MKMRILLVIGLSLILCQCDGRVRLRATSPAEYHSDVTCWQDANGNFEAWMILSHAKQGFTPTFISTKCVIKEDKFTEMESIAEYRNAILFSGKIILNNVLRNNDILITSNTYSEKVPISLNDQILYVRSVETPTLHHGSFRVYLKNIEKVTGPEITFRQLLSQRARILKSAA